MNDRSTRLGRVAKLTLLVGAAFAGGALSARTTEADSARRNPYALYDELARALLLVENQYVEPAERDRLVEGAIKGMVAELDPHSAYMSPKEYAEFRSDTEGRFGGIGVELDLRGEQIIVIAPFEGSPAERAGIRSGDHIVSIDGVAMRGERLDKLVGRMRGEAGTKVRVSVRRAGASETLHFDLVREIIKVKSVSGERLERDVGYVRIKQFQEGTHEELLAVVGAIKKQSDKPLAGVVLDLRFNPGGLVDEAEAVADELLDAGSIYSTRHRGRVLEEAKARPGGALARVPLVVLVNEYSASSSELVAGAVQDNARATIMGAQTFGKGSVQTIFELPGGGGMRLTTMRYYTPGGRSIQALGIDPDVKVLLDGGPAEVVREADLSGHLPEEAKGPARKQEVVTEPKKPAPAPGSKPSEVPPFRQTPKDPSKSADFVLALAFERLTRAK
jgi:carboxyl-terminal processing protease